MKNSKIKYCILALIVLVIFLVYLFLNYGYIKATFKVHKLVRTNNINNTLFVQYAKNAAETRVRGCTPMTKVLFLSCSKTVSNWALGSYGKQLDSHLSTLNNDIKANNTTPSNKKFWNTTYNYTNIDVLEQRIENLLNENYRNEELYKKTIPFFYNVRIVNDQKTYYLEFTVWKRNESCKDDDILSLLTTVVQYQLLKEEDFRKNIKVVIELYGGSEGDDLIRKLYDGYME